jgi:hypothetical protein
MELMPFNSPIPTQSAATTMPMRKAGFISLQSLSHTNAPAGD